MPEEFLHFIWQFQLFDHSLLECSNGQSIQVLSPGIRNSNSGPDFTEARLLIDGKQWVGNIEIHVNTSDWFKHNHQFDPAYKSVILHVVNKHDDLDWEKKTSSIPILQMLGRIDSARFYIWESLQRSKDWIPCQSNINTVPKLHLSHMIHRSSIERLERKVYEVELMVNESKGHWEYALMQCILVSFGGKVNKDATRILARLLPFEIIKKNLHNSLLLASLLFGIAGFLERDFKDHYPNELKLEFMFLKLKYNFPTMDSSIWKFLRMRPANFPSFRLAQFVSLLERWDEIVKCLFYNGSIENLEELIRQPYFSYWKTHYRFDHRANIRGTKIGSLMYNSILINAIVPFLYYYGSKHGDDEKKMNALSILERMKPESNAIISGWKKLGIAPINSFETQGLIEIKNSFCSFKKCLSCEIGVRIMNPLKNDKKDIRLF